MNTKVSFNVKTSKQYCHDKCPQLKTYDDGGMGNHCSWKCKLFNTDLSERYIEKKGDKKVRCNQCMGRSEDENE